MLATSDGWQLRGLEVLGDLDADGAVDFRVAAWDAYDLPIEVVVRGPLAGQTVPGDEWFALGVDGYIYDVGDVDGDGIVDLHWEGDLYGLVLGPIDGPPAPEEILGSIPGFRDIDGDGIRDKFLSTSGTYYDSWPTQLEVTWGPLERFTGPADVVIGPLCRDGYDADYFGGDVLAPGDLDGDGDPELSISPYGWFYGSGDCGDFTVSLPRSGTVDPFTSPRTADRLVANVVRVGDLNGDGLDEVMTDSMVVASPIGLAPSELTGSAEVALAAELVQVHPFAPNGPFGVWDVLGTRVVAPITDLQGFGWYHADTAWEIGLEAVTTEPFVEEGRVKVAFLDGDVVRVADLGPAG